MSILEPPTTRWKRRATGTLAASAMVAAGFVALAAPASAAGNTIYVNSAGSSAEDCGASFKACKTIQAGIDNAEPDDTVQVAAGTYNALVKISKPLTLKGDEGATIDGANVTTPNGLVNINDPGGDVTVTGFTIKNQVAAGGGNDDSYGVTINDGNADDTITVSDNSFPGVSPARTEEIPYGVNSANTLAKQVITNNEFANLWRGVLLEGVNGPVDVSDNVFHDLIAVPTGAESGPNAGKVYPAKGVFILADGSGGVSDQAITGNTFRDYAGIGVSIRAGYDLGGCADRACDGSVTAAATNNTFQLDPQAELNSPAENQQVAAFNVQSLDEVDVLNLALSGNVGTVPGEALIVAAGDGSVDITPTPSPLTLTPATSSFAAGKKQTFTATLTDVLGNPTSGAVVTFDNGEGPGVLNKTSATTDDSGKATVTLTTATDDIGPGTVTATATPASGEVKQVAKYTAVAIDTVTPTLGTLAAVGSTQSVTVQVKNTDGTAPAAGTPVDVVVSGKSVTNGTVTTNASGTATFTFTVQHAGSFTVKATAGGKSASVTGNSPARAATTTLTSLTSPSKGTIVASATISPAQAGKTVGFYFIVNGAYQLYGSALTNSKGVATRTIPNRVSGATYRLAARLYGDPDLSSGYAVSRSIKVK